LASELLTFTLLLPEFETPLLDVALPPEALADDVEPDVALAPEVLLLVVVLGVVVGVVGVGTQINAMPSTTS
jgi:hypothetical protein